MEASVEDHHQHNALNNVDQSWVKLQQANFCKGSGPNSQFHYVTRFQLNSSSMKSQTNTKKSEVRKQLYTNLYCGVWQSTLCIILLTEMNAWLHWTSLPKLLSYYLFFIWKRKLIVSDYGWRIMDWSTVDPHSTSCTSWSNSHELDHNFSASLAS